MSHPFTLVFLAALAAALAIRIWLALRHLRHVARHADAVPEAFRERISLAEHRKAARYTAARVHAGLVELVAEAIVLLAFTLGGGLDWIDRAWRGLELAPLATGVAVLLSVLLIGALLDLPFAAHRTFRVEARFGFNRTTPGLFLADQARELVLLVVLVGPLLALVLWLLEHAGAWWWLYAWAAWLAFSLAMVWAYPVLIAPLFNRFTPLDAGEVRRRAEDLLARNGLALDGTYVMDGSRRSGHGNAYFTGLGRHRRIVFYDTLLARLDAQEVEAVLAHEVGHYRRRHVPKRVALMALMSLAGLAVLGWLSQQAWFYSALGVGQPSGHAALALFGLVSPVFGFFLQPALAWASRRHEFEADQFAAAQSGAATLVRALVKLYADNAATLTPDPLYSAFHDSHPPAPVRVARLAAHRAAL